MHWWCVCLVRIYVICYQKLSHWLRQLQDFLSLVLTHLIPFGSSTVNVLVFYYFSDGVQELSNRFSSQINRIECKSPYHMLYIQPYRRGSTQVERYRTILTFLLFYWSSISDNAVLYLCIYYTYSLVIIYISLSHDRYKQKLYPLLK